MLSERVKENIDQRFAQCKLRHMIKPQLSEQWLPDTKINTQIREVEIEVQK